MDQSITHYTKWSCSECNATYELDDNAPIDGELPFDHGWKFIGHLLLCPKHKVAVTIDGIERGPFPKETK